MLRKIKIEERNFKNIFQVMDIYPAYETKNRLAGLSQADFHLIQILYSKSTRNRVSEDSDFGCQEGKYHEEAAENH